MIQKFSFEELDLKDAYLIKPFVAYDERGYFIKDYSKEVFESNGIKHDLKEVFYTSSHAGVIRAIHFQRVNEQAKLVRCVSGEIYDVIVDLRKDSPTFGQWKGFYLSEENKNALYVPEGFGHGYLVIKPSIVSYQCAEKFYGEYDDGIMWDDPEIGINWPLHSVDTLILSEKDKNLQSFAEFKNK
ncbi:MULTISPECIES: dTDP-4-dehydrorhamnose 3,5-epimerase [Bacillus cereus group]|uniref:dTDP-4-dehydrorhamnose 3,5-epimerase n=1 Tax=Bacillus cereus TaxID=1396 RepID=A0AB73UH20_BACCE|nr:dTDP-4-dehydrorhamnose 3,5-epimerase [Bacillus cereus]MCB4335833.1 dTDP-4-dehydrorhamnose 3,5-epimerase [Bacillus cereus]MCC2457006.1 dTDP-4-dehydrorhamnose 3,5-epimerase [Bacillus cereus]PFX71805.1 dTDP-4-dehydrorhamnose 3,5-epimerase [Bacillus cereus]PGW84873.1 dTDP-4-dehydrorhamnose 3,5-epimerase [Bacillus cereus]QHV07306.1 dTDP-4-dehydrorhamnose 3,5-epimerase [Bacillus cereus]